MLLPGVTADTTSSGPHPHREQPAGAVSQATSKGSGAPAGHRDQADASLPDPAAQHGVQGGAGPAPAPGRMADRAVSLRERRVEDGHTARRLALNCELMTTSPTTADGIIVPNFLILTPLLHLASANEM